MNLMGMQKNILNGSKFELPSIFGRLFDGQPPQTQAGRESRAAADMLAQPNFGLHDPATLHFPNHNAPTVPGNGGYVTMGLGPIVYDHQPQWNRDALPQAGPVRLFFRGLLYDNRVKHL